MNDGSYKDFFTALNNVDKGIYELAKLENRIWTELAEGDNFWIALGLHFVNRIAIYVTDKPCSLDLLVEEPLDVM